MVKYKIIADTSYKKEQRLKDFLSFFIQYLAVPWPALGHHQGDRVIDPVLIFALFKFQPKSHWGPHNNVGFLSPPERLVKFEPETFLDSFIAP